MGKNNQFVMDQGHVLFYGRNNYKDKHNHCRYDIHSIGGIITPVWENEMINPYRTLIPVALTLFFLLYGCMHNVKSHRDADWNINILEKPEGSGSTIDRQTVRRKALKCISGTLLPK